MKRLLDVLAGDSASALASSYESAARERGLTPDPETVTLAAVLVAAYPALRTQILTRPGDVVAIAKGQLRIARDLRGLRRIAASFVSDLDDSAAVRSGLRLFAQRERLRVAARELGEGEDLDVTAREISDIAQVCIELATTEAQRWAERRFGTPLTASGERCAFTVLGMGKLGGRELNCGSDVDLLIFYDTDDGEVRPSEAARESSSSLEQTLHEHFARITQRLTATLEDVTDEGISWRVDLRLRPEGSRGPLVNSLAAAERYYETWGRTWERAALLRARPVAGDLAFGQQVLDALASFVWRKVVDPRIAVEMTELVQRGRVELSSDPERDLKLGPGGIREAEFFVQSLQLIWGGREPSLRLSNTLEALRRLRMRGLVTDRESREVDAAYLTLRRLEHRVQFATGQQTHILPRGELLETIAKSVGYATGRELEKDLDRTRRRVATRFASLMKNQTRTAGTDASLAAIWAALDSGDEAQVLAAVSERAPGLDFRAPTPDLARHLLALARRPDFPLGATSRDRHPDLALVLLEALAHAADPEQAARLLAAFFARLATPSVYARAMADDQQVVRKLVALFGASAFLGESLVYHPELVESVLFTKGLPTPEYAAHQVEAEITDARAAAADQEEVDPEDAFVGALRHARSRLLMEVGLAELSGELRTRSATMVLSAVADATLEHATRHALEEKGLMGGLTVIAMGKLGGREIGYGSDLDIFFIYEAGTDEDGSLSERYVRAAQRVLRLVSAPHGSGAGYELDTRLRPSGSQGLLVVSLEAFARYHGQPLEGASPPSTPREAQDWERQALIKARPCAGDAGLGARFAKVATQIAYERGAPDADRVHHLRMRMERELAREAPHRFDLKLGHGGIVDVEFAAQWLQMRHGQDPRVRTSDTETSLAALEACGYLDGPPAAVLREGYAFLRRLEQALRVVHGTSASLIEEGAPGVAALARRMGFRDDRGAASDALFERYRAVTRDVRAAYLSVLGIRSPKDPL